MKSRQLAFMVFGLFVHLNLLAAAAPWSPDERYFGTDSFVPDWRAAEELDAKATDLFLTTYWPQFKKGYDQGGSEKLSETTPEIEAAGVAAFISPSTTDIMPDYLPSAAELNASKVRLFAAKGESEPFVIGVRTLGKDKTISIQVSDLKNGEKIFSKDDISVRMGLPYEAKVRVGRNPDNSSKYEDKMRSMVMIKPPEGKWKFPKNYSLCYIVDFHVPASAEPGTYEGTVKVLVDDATVKTVSVSLEVLPFSLKTNNFHAGAFGISYKRFSGGFLGYFEPMVEIDSRYGYNLAGGFFNKGRDIPFKKGSAPLEIDTESERFQKFDEVMQRLKKYGMGQVAFWNWGASGNVEHFNSILADAGFGKIDTESGKKGFGEVCKVIKFGEVCKVIKDAEKKYGWPELVINPFDESLDDQDATREVIEAMPFVRETSPETRIYMTEWHTGYTRIYQSKGTILKGKKRPGDDDYKKIPANETPVLNFHVIGSNVGNDDSRVIQDQLGGEYWTYGSATRVNPQTRYLYGFQGYRTHSEAVLVWANWRGTLEGDGWTVNFVIPTDPSGIGEAKAKADLHGPALPSVRSVLVREGIDDRKYIETLKYYARTKKSQEDLDYLKELEARCKNFASMKGVGGRENVEAEVSDADALQSLRIEVKDRILKLIQK
jgi:hypothetical protein